jgi:hypothetical protein
MGYHRPFGTTITPIDRVVPSGRPIHRFAGRETVTLRFAAGDREDSPRFVQRSHTTDPIAFGPSRAPKAALRLAKTIEGIAKRNSRRKGCIPIR